MKEKGYIVEKFLREFEYEDLVSDLEIFVKKQCKSLNIEINFDTSISPFDSFNSLILFRYDSPPETSEIAPHFEICASELVIAK